MAAFDTTRPAHGAFAGTSHIKGLAVNLIARLIAWNDARVTRNALNQLTDRELEDIGLVRGDIDDVANSR